MAYLTVVIMFWVPVFLMIIKVSSQNNMAEKNEAVQDLIHRLIGEKSKSFQVSIDPGLSDNGLDVFKILKTEGSNRVQIYGSSGVAAAWAFHYYLKEYCNCHISWDGDQVDLPETLPDVQVTVTANDRYRYYQNVCTTSYSFVWWNWTRWEREIDWMALNGINLALAFNGQEEIWRRVFVKLNLDNAEIDEHFTGPAFLSWNRMGNLRGWGGPLSKSWHENSVKLQKLILNRMRALGITPVLPAFSGLVPRAFRRIFPEANMTSVIWLTFQTQYCCVYYLSPLEKLFEKIGEMFLTEYINEFGTNNMYNCDSFNEMTPPSGDEDYLRSTGQAVYKSMTNVDPKAIWIMQSWLFRNAEHFWTKSRAKALLTSVPLGKMLILDLQAEQLPQYPRMDSFFGQPFIWCMLHNFGGTLGLHGNINSVNNNVFLARNFTNSTMVGIGIAPEGINQNYVVYDLMNEMAFRKVPVNITEWSENYASRRYNYRSRNASEAWILLMKSVYDYTGPEQHGKYIFVQQPSFYLEENVWYDKEDVWKAWDYILKAAQEMENFTVTFQYDVVDITRQSLQLYLDVSYENLVKFFKTEDAVNFRAEYVKFLRLLKDMDELLESLPHFLLGRWIQDAKDSGTTPLEKEIYARNAKNQITLWGPLGEISDYACKQWAGLVKGYYYPRWRLFLKTAYKSLRDRTSFNESTVADKIFSLIEQPFTYSVHNFSIHPLGDPIKIALELHKRWYTFQGI